MRILSAFVKTIGLWTTLAGYFCEIKALFVLGLIMLVLAWYLLDFSYYRSKNEDNKEMDTVRMESK